MSASAPRPLRRYGPPELAEDDFRLFQALVQREAGIQLTSTKRALLVSRLSARLRTLGLDSFGAYYRKAISDESELVHMLDCIATNETSFFREPGQFAMLEGQVFPHWQREAAAGRRRRLVRAWSAGCSTGEEPFSLAMSLLAAFPLSDGFELEVVATDLSTRVLRQARSATYSLDKSLQIPGHHLRRYMRRGIGSQAGRMRAGKELRRIVRFERLNLTRDVDPRLGSFDLVLCRNVLIYFEPEAKRNALRRLLRCLNANGLLLLGHSEALLGATDRLRSIAPSIFAWRNPSST
jgi:chemotaxis protein methyltransferase CheR